MVVSKPDTVVSIGKLINMIIQEEKLLTVNETARYLSLSTQTIRKWINTGKLNAVKIGKEFRIRLSELNDLVN